MLTLKRPADYRLSNALSGLRMGSYDPSLRLSKRAADWAMRGPSGPLAVSVEQTNAALHCQIWGNDRDWLAPRLPAMLGLEDDPSAFAPEQPQLGQLLRRVGPTPLPRLPLVTERLVQIVLLQLVNYRDATSSWRRLLLADGVDAPGPAGLRTLPAVEQLAHLPYYALARHGILRRQAETIARVAGQSAVIERAACASDRALQKRLESIPGVGPWTIGYLLGSARADADAVLLGDYKLAKLVCWILAGEQHGDDQRMLELLEPYRGQRYRLVRLLFVAGARLPRRGPRAPAALPR
ncbi:MAG: DNA-3-methyladenine glycosylase 2 family protein [Deltaproteobacteria bacterium]|nr:DNA-3-methyladenine glycosylase 2 family protein [Deltaproteobacteria bacterium]